MFSVCVSALLHTQEQEFVRDFAFPPGKAEPSVHCLGEGCLCARRHVQPFPLEQFLFQHSAWVSPRLLSAGRGAEISPWKFAAPGLNFSMS